MKKLVLLFIGIIIVSGCSSPVQNKTVCSKTVSGMTDTTTLKGEDGELQQITMNKIIQADESSIDQLKAELDVMKDDKYNIKGVTYNYEIRSDYSVTIKCVVNVEKADPDEMYAAGLAHSVKGDDEVFKVEETVKNFEDNGYTCVEEDE